MNYREFGKTGEKISALGFGCMRFPEYQEGEKNFVDQDNPFRHAEPGHGAEECKDGLG
ncbi:hypothetical protein [uncultured Acetatifactor sp.]|uniref:hypothetical protein n=1 Tax=uncultured Acetatifactor sp. TaxID=1671927 RepID=UPI0026136D8D|nr:hypothetical protein [uncultured Acetatifactor sp.]